MKYANVFGRTECFYCARINNTNFYLQSFQNVLYFARYQVLIDFFSNLDIYLKFTRRKDFVLLLLQDEIKKKKTVYFIHFYVFISSVHNMNE